MDNASLLVVAMAEQCKNLIQRSDKADLNLPRALHPHHLLWMCERIVEHSEEWSPTKLHRWIGFLQGGMLANRILDFQEIKAMFAEAKNAYGGNGDDEDLIDHLHPDSSFHLDLGGQG